MAFNPDAWAFGNTNSAAGYGPQSSRGPQSFGQDYQQKAFNYGDYAQNSSLNLGDAPGGPGDLGLGSLGTYNNNSQEEQSGRGRWGKMLFGQNNDDGTRTPGALMPMLNTFTGLASAYIGMKQYGLAKDSFRQNRKEFGLNYDAQRQATNAQMEGSAKARHSANPDFYDTPSEYMDKNGIAERKG